MSKRKVPATASEDEQSNAKRAAKSEENKQITQKENKEDTITDLFGEELVQEKVSEEKDVEEADEEEDGEEYEERGPGLAALLGSDLEDEEEDSDFAEPDDEDDVDIDDEEDN